jgi:hypothetical protein
MEEGKKELSFGRFFKFLTCQFRQHSFVQKVLAV